MAEPRTHIIDEGSLHMYRTEIPNTIIRGARSKGLSVYAKWLYVYLKSVTGDTGECFRTTTTISVESGLPRGTVSRTKTELAHYGLIRITKGERKNRDTDRIAIVNIWQANMKEFDAQCSRGELQCSSGEHQQVVENTSHAHSSVPGGNSSVPGGNSSVPQTTLKKIPIKNTNPYCAKFLEFWEAYPVKKAKGEAARAWESLGIVRAGLADTVIASVQAHHLHDTDWRRGYIKLPATYLNKRCWEDEFPAARPHTRKVASV